MSIFLPLERIPRGPYMRSQERWPTDRLRGVLGVVGSAPAILEEANHRRPRRSQIVSVPEKRHAAGTPAAADVSCRVLLCWICHHSGLITEQASTIDGEGSLRGARPRAKTYRVQRTGRLTG